MVYEELKNNIDAILLFGEGTDALENDSGIIVFLLDNCEIIIPENVQHIKSYAFYKCKSAEQIIISDSVQKIDSYAFEYCSGATNVIIGNGVTSIGNSSFAYCTAMSRLIIGTSLASAGSYAFSDCDSLLSVILPGSLTTVSSYMFYFCDNLQEVIINEGTTRIQGAAFKYCDNLTSVTLPISLTYVHCYDIHYNGWPDAFDYFTHPINVFYAGSKEQWDKISGASENFGSGVTIYLNYVSAT